MCCMGWRGGEGALLPIWRDVEDAVAESAEAEGGVFEADLGGEGDAEEADVVDDWGGDCGDEEEEDAEPVRYVSL